MSRSHLTRLLCAGALSAASLAALVPSASAATPLRGTTTINERLVSTPLGDVNGDGLDDLGLVADGKGTIALGSRTQANITSADPAKLPGGGLPVSSTVSGFPVTALSAAGDVDGDGIDDLIVTADAGYIVYGSRTLGAVTVPSAAATKLVGVGGAQAIGDFDGDGRDDLSTAWITGSIGATNMRSGAVIIRGGPRVASIPGTAPSTRGFGLSTPPKCTFSFVFFRIICQTLPPILTPVGDFDGDGRDDVAVDGYSEGARYVLFGSAGRSGQVNPATPGGRIMRLAAVGAVNSAGLKGAGDVNGDGRADLVFTRASGAGTTNADRAILLGRAAPPASLSLGADAIALRSSGNVLDVAPVGDQDGDGRGDLAITTERRPLTLLTKVGLAAPSVVDLGAAAKDIPGLPLGAAYPKLIGDLDGDAQPDLLLQSYDPQRPTYIAAHGTDQAAPQLADLALVVDRFETGASPKGTTLSVDLAEPARITFTATTEAGTVAGSFASNFLAGHTDLPWNGSVNGKALAPGRYTLTAVPRDATYNAGAAVTKTFEVLAAGSPPVRNPAFMQIGTVIQDPGNQIPDPTSVTYRGTCFPGGTITATGPQELYYKDIPNRTLFEGDTCTVTLGSVGGLTAAEQARCSWKAAGQVNGIGQPTEAFSPVTIGDVLSVTVFLTCVPTGTGGVIQPLGTGWRTAGSATLGSGAAAGSTTLTPAAAGQTGSAFWPTAMDPNGKTFTFVANLSGGNGAAEGLALVFAKPADGSLPAGGLLGTGGGGLGFAGLPGVAVALDVNRQAGDPAANFVGIADGPKADSLDYLQTADPGVRLRGNPVTVTVVSKDGRVSVWVGGRLRMERTMTLPSPAFVGLTAATGASIYESHTASGLVVSAS